MAQETFALAIPFDTLSGTQKLPAYLNPSSPDYGGITIVSGVANFSGTSNFTLVTMTNVGTPVANGTISAANGGTATVGVPYALTISDGWVDSGEYIGIQSNSGTALSGLITLTYVMGRQG